MSPADGSTESAVERQASLVPIEPKRRDTWLLTGLATLYVFVVLVYSVGWMRWFTPDAMNYVDVARNIAAGRGISQSTVGFNQARLPEVLEFPQPYVAQGPLFPLLVAGLSSTGLSEVDAALVLPALGLALALWAGAVLGKQLFGVEGGVAALVLLIMMAPLRRLAATAGTDSIGAGLALLFLAAVVRASTKPARLRWWVAAGIVAGASFALRFALGPLVLLGLAAAVLTRASWPSRLRSASAFAGATAPLYGAVLIRNLCVSGSLFVEKLPSTVGLGSNIRYAALALTCLSPLPDSLGLWLAGLVIIVVALGIARSPTYRRRIIEAYWRKPSVLVFVWIVLYLVFLVGERSLHHFDRISARLTLPATVPLVVLFAGLVPVKMLRSWKARCGLGIAALAVGIIGMHVLSENPSAFAISDWPTAQSSRSQRLQWIHRNIGPDDLLIGNATIDAVFLLRLPAAVSFSYFPYAEHLRHEHVTSVVHDHAGAFDRFFLVLRRWPRSSWPDEEAAQRFYGPFVTDLLMGRHAAYENVRLVATIEDALVFELVE